MTLLLTTTIGFAYVSVVLCGRSNPFESGNNGYLDFVLLCGLVGLCLAVPLQEPRSCTDFDERRNPIWLISLMSATFFASLHWAFFGGLMDVDFSLTPHQIATLDVRSIIVLGVAAIAVTMILGFHLRRAVQCGILMRHSIWFAVFAALIVIPTIYLADTHYLHFSSLLFGIVFRAILQIRHYSCLLYTSPSPRDRG